MRALWAGLLVTAAIPGSYFQPLSLDHTPYSMSVDTNHYCFLTPNKDGVSKRTSV